MEHWDEVRTALAVATHGTVSAAATHLGVHRSTVVRHIDTLEASLGHRLFQRHAHGYEATEAGDDLVRVAEATREQLQALQGRLQGRANSVSGELVLTSPALLAPLLMPGLARFRRAHPDTRVRYEVSDRLYRLEYGEAHVAVRAGRRPDDPDNVVGDFLTLTSALYALEGAFPLDDAPGYIVDSGAGTDRWLATHVPDAPVVLSTNKAAVAIEAVQAGLGIGFCPVWLADRHGGLVQVHPPEPAWSLPCWTVTHVDLHRSAKVQAALRHLREGLAAGP